MEEMDLEEMYYKLDSTREVKDLVQMAESLKEHNIKNPYFRMHDNIANDTTRIDNKELINFASYNYLGFAGDERVKDMAKKAIDEYGTTVSASRSIAGERPIHRILEKEIADFLGADDAIAVISGYTTNFTTIGHLYHRKDLILYDELSHNSILQGAYLSKAKMMPFSHNDTKSLENLLKKHRNEYRKTLIVTEGVYSVDGDIPDLPKLIEIKNKYKSNLMIDEAHSFGTIGKTGRGITEYFGVDPKEVDILMGTLSKSLASCGGYIAGSELLIKYLKFTMPGFVYSVGLTPANTGAAIAALKLLKEHPEKVDKLRDNSAYFLNQARKQGFNTGKSNNSAVIPIIIGSSIKAMQASDYLYDNGINVLPMIFPAVTEGEASLRFFIGADHTKEQIDITLEKLKKGII